MAEPVIVFIEGGCLLHVHGVEDYYLVDWDNLEGSNWCPLCNIELPDFPSQVCSKCGLDWETAEAKDVTAKIKKMEEELKIEIQAEEKTNDE
jgi:hypothetical protein